MHLQLSSKSSIHLFKCFLIISSLILIINPRQIPVPDIRTGQVSKAISEAPRRSADRGRVKKFKPASRQGADHLTSHSLKLVNAFFEPPKIISAVQIGRQLEKPLAVVVAKIATPRSDGAECPSETS